MNDDDTYALDARLTVTPQGNGRGRWYHAACGECGTRLALGDNLDRTVALAIVNTTARPCCAAWIPVDVDPLDRGAP